MKPLRSVLVLIVTVLTLGTLPAAAQIDVELPDRTALEAGTSVDIPIYLEEEIEAGDDIRSFQFEIAYDSNLLTVTGVETSGTLSDGWTSSSFTPSAGQFNGAITNTSPLVGGPGVLIILEAEILPSVTGTSPLTFLEFSFNEGSPSANSTDGNISVGNNLVITEVHADPASGLAGDANGDGTRSFDDDEFIEILNVSASPIDLSNYTLFDAGDDAPRFTFPSGTVLTPNTSAVVFGGGTLNGFPGLTFTAGTLGLNNGGDTVTLHDENETPITAVTYGPEGGNNQSITRSPDPIDPFVLHLDTPGGERFSPGRLPDGSPLPVELESFSAVRDGQDAVLQWATASETNNSGFSVQQRRAGTFQEIAFVNGAGTTNQRQQYTHRVRDLDAGTYTFRLEQIDFDGTTTPSSSVEVSIPLAQSFALTAAYPNPFRNTARFALEVQETQDVSVTLYNMLGQRIRSVFDGTVRAGTPQALVIDGNNLSSGVYVYRIKGRTFSTTRQIALVK